MVSGTISRESSAGTDMNVNDDARRSSFTSVDSFSFSETGKISHLAPLETTRCAVTVLVAAGSSALVNTPYLVMRSLMGQVIDHAGGLSAAMLLLGGDDVNAGLLRWLMEGGDSKSNDRTGDRGGDGGGGSGATVGGLVIERHVTSQLARLCASLIGAVSPACIIVDNAQWLDAGSWALCTQLASRCSNCLLLLASRRKVAADIAFSTFAATPNLKVFDVGPLPTNEARALVTHFYPVLEMNEQALAAVLHIAGGTPMFLREMVRRCQNSGGWRDLVAHRFFFLLCLWKLSVVDLMHLCDAMLKCDDD